MSASTFMRDTSLRFLQVLYAQREPGNYHYEADERQTDIIICDQYAELAVKEQRPMIIGVRGPVQWQNVAINNGMVTKNLTHGHEEHTDNLLGSFGISCVSRNGMEAESIASDIMDAFRAFKRELQKAGFFHIRSANMSAQRLVEQAGYQKLFMVNVSVICQVQMRWVLDPTVEIRLRKIVLSALTQGDTDPIFTATIKGESP